MILQYLDTAIGFALVMVLFSMLIMVLVQFVVAILGLRGSTLHWGVSRLLRHVSPDLGDGARDVADAVLRHEAVAHTGIWGRGKLRRATAIRQAELLALLEDLTSEDREALTEGAKKSLAATLETVRSDLGMWFDTFMDRTTERFVLRTRWWTAGLALVLCVVLHIDSLDILRQLTSDATLRSQLVAASQGMLQEAEGTLALRADQGSLASQAIQLVSANHAVDSAFTVLRAEPGTLRTRQEGEAWLRRELSGAPILQEALTEYGDRFDEVTRSWIGELQSSAARLNDRLSEANLRLIADDVPDLGRYRSQRGHLVGVLLSVALLSLGAPFWYNALQKLSNVRPILASKVESESTTESSSG